jgi:protein phosphatase
VHGGLFWDDLTIPQINEIKRFHEIPPTGSHMEQMLWSDPDPEHGRQDSPRGASLLFGPDVTERFMADNGVSLIVRSHECMQQGFEKMHNDTLITVFSASNYCKSVGNDGAFVIFEKDMAPKIVTFYAKPKERLSRYRMRHALLENDIISKLLQRISDNRLGLVNYYRSVETKVGGIGTVTRQQWAEGLKKVLKLNIPFLEFQDYLGLPKLGVDGKKKGAIDHMVYNDSSS